MTRLIKNNKLYTFFIILIFIGITLAVAYNIIGSEIDNDGIVREPFFLVPLSYLFVLTGLIGFAISFIIKVIRKYKQSK